MSSISNRINELVNYFSGGNVSKFSALVGFSEANVRNYINGTQPKSEFLSKLIDVFEINGEWLLSGRGTMLKSESSKPEAKQDYKLPADKEFELMRKLNELHERLSEALERERKLLIELYGDRSRDK